MRAPFVFGIPAALLVGGVAQLVTRAAAAHETHTVRGPRVLPPVRAQTRPAPRPPAPPPRRSVWFAATYQHLFSDALSPAHENGAGAWASYEFHVSPRFLVGLPLGYRAYPGEGGAHQIGYGVTLRHFFSDAWARGARVYPFIDYGLLQQQSFAPGRSGVAVSHDTRLGGGVVFGQLGFPLFLASSAHLSRLEFFDVDGEWIPFIDVSLGGILAF